MTRAGREPAEDVKRRLIAACEEVGLTVKSAKMQLTPEKDLRFIHVASAPDDWPEDSHMLTVVACVSTAGDWSRLVHIHCRANPIPNPLLSPWMTGRSTIRIEDLVHQLRDTLDERQQVEAAIKSGVNRPYKFARSVWQVPNFSQPGQQPPLP